jgi:hypothetical protein
LIISLQYVDVSNAGKIRHFIDDVTPRTLKDDHQLGEVGVLMLGKTRVVQHAVLHVKPQTVDDIGISFAKDARSHPESLMVCGAQVKDRIVLTK